MLLLALAACSDADGTAGVSDGGSGEEFKGRIYGYFQQDSGCSNSLVQYIEHSADGLTAELHDIDCSTGAITRQGIDPADLIILERAGGTVVHDGSVYRTISSNLDELSPPTEFDHAFCFIEEPNDDFFYYRLLLYSEDQGDNFGYAVDRYSSSISPQDGHTYHNEGSSGASVVFSTTDLLIDYQSSSEFQKKMIIDLTSKDSSNLFPGTLTLDVKDYAATCAINSDFLP